MGADGPTPEAEPIGSPAPEELAVAALPAATTAAAPSPAAPLPAPLPEPARSVAIPPWLVGAGAIVLVVFLGVPAYRFACAGSGPSALELNAEAERLVGSGSYEAATFLMDESRIVAGGDPDRVRELIRAMYARGAVRVMAVRLDSTRRVAGALVVELPPSDGMRRQIFLEITRYHANGRPFDESAIEAGGFDERFVLLDFFRPPPLDYR